MEMESNRPRFVEKIRAVHAAALVLARAVEVFARPEFHNTVSEQNLRTQIEAAQRELRLIGKKLDDAEAALAEDIVNAQSTS